MMIRERSGVLLLKNFCRSYPVEVDTISSLFLNPYLIHCIGHTRRRGNGWFWDQASILGNRATSTWQPISLLLFQRSFVFENYICKGISCLSFKSPIFIYMYIYSNFWEFLSLHNYTNWIHIYLFLWYLIMQSILHEHEKESCQFCSHERESITKKLFVKWYIITAPHWEGRESQGHPLLPTWCLYTEDGK